MAEKHIRYEKPEECHFHITDPLDKYPEETFPADVESATKANHIVAMIAGEAVVERDVAAETRLRWKIDLCMMPIVWLVYLWTFIDRVNIGNARLAGLERTLGMVGTDYNTAVAIFYAGYITCELPSAMAAKIFGPGRWLPFLTVAFGIVSMCTAFVNTYNGLLGLRVILGALEAGMLPGLAFYVSRWYRRDELVFRIAIFITAAPFAGAFGGLLAGAIFAAPDFGIIQSWEKLFFIEGLVTIATGVLAWFFMPDRPANAWFLTESEKALCEFRAKSEMPAANVAIERTRWQAVKHGIFNWNAWLIGFIFFLQGQIVLGLSVFFPTVIRQMYPGTTVTYQQLKTVPPYIVGAVFVLIQAYVAWKLNRKGIVMMVSGTVLAIGYAMWISDITTNAKYGGSFLITGGCFGFGATINGWIAANAAPETSRAAAIGVTNFMATVGGLVSCYLYFPQNAAGGYKEANTWLMVAAVLCVILAGSCWLYQVRENKLRAAGKRDHRLYGLSADEISLLGHRHPEFRYTH